MQKCICWSFWEDSFLLPKMSFASCVTCTEENGKHGGYPMSLRTTEKSKKRNQEKSQQVHSASEFSYIRQKESKGEREIN